MAYITQTDIEAKVKGSAILLRIIRSTSFDATALAAIAEAIAESDGIVNTYAEGTAGYPWTVVPQQAKTCSLALCIERLYQAWPIPGNVKDEANAAREMLFALLEGETTWVIGNTPAKQNLSHVFVYLPGDTLSSGNPRRATRDVLDKL